MTGLSYACILTYMNNIFQIYKDKEEISFHQFGIRLGVTAQGAKHLCDRPMDLLGRTKLDIILQAEELGIPVLMTYEGILLEKKKELLTN